MSNHAISQEIVEQYLDWFAATEANTPELFQLPGFRNAVTKICVKGEKNISPENYEAMLIAIKMQMAESRLHGFGKYIVVLEEAYYGVNEETVMRIAKKVASKIIRSERIEITPFELFRMQSTMSEMRKRLEMMEKRLSNMEAVRYF